jgi:hypothetical protein
MAEDAAEAREIASKTIREFAQPGCEKAATALSALKGPAADGAFLPVDAAKEAFSISPVSCVLEQRDGTHICSGVWVFAAELPEDVVEAVCGNGSVKAVVTSSTTAKWFTFNEAQSLCRETYGEGVVSRWCECSFAFSFVLLLG